MRKKMTFREDQITDMILYMVGSIDSEKEPDEEQRTGEWIEEDEE